MGIVCTSKQFVSICSFRRRWSTATPCHVHSRTYHVPCSVGLVCFTVPWSSIALVVMSRLIVFCTSIRSTSAGPGIGPIPRYAVRQIIVHRKEMSGIILCPRWLYYHLTSAVPPLILRDTKTLVMWLSLNVPFVVPLTIAMPPSTSRATDCVPSLAVACRH